MEAAETSAIEPDATSATEILEPEPDQPFSADEGDSKNPLITPISSYEHKKPYDQAREVLLKAQQLWKKGEARLASETALEAYDDLISIRVSRKQKAARRKLLAERRQAAQVYVEAGIVYIKEYVNRNGDNATARTEGRARLAILRDVSRDYPDLNSKLSRALDAWSAS